MVDTSRWATIAAPVGLRDPGTPTRRQRRHLARRERVVARLAELEVIKEVLGEAAVRVHRAWCQGSWTAVLETSAARGVCLVSAIRICGPSEGVGAPAEQVTNRAVDTAWHALHHDPDGLRWTPDPAVRLARVRDLARWNDRPGREVGEVSTLLARSVGYADDEAWRLRREHWL